MIAYIAENLGGFAVLAGGVVLTLWGFLMVMGAPPPPRERDDETPTNPKGKTK